MRKLTKAQKEEREKAISTLRTMFDCCDVAKDHRGLPIVYTTLRHVSRSGMRRVIDVHVVTAEGLQWIGYTTALATGYKQDRKYQGIIMDGCGMDMGFALVYALSAALYGHEERGGYRLSHRWV